MNSLLPRGMPKREQPMPCSQANDAEIGLFAGLISVDTALGARNKLKAVENWPTGWFFCKLLTSPLVVCRASNGNAREVGVDLAQISPARDVYRTRCGRRTRDNGDPE
jgi:hypothetical protein